MLPLLPSERRSESTADAISPDKKHPQRTRGSPKQKQKESPHFRGRPTENISRVNSVSGPPKLTTAHPLSGGECKGFELEAGRGEGGAGNSLACQDCE